MKTAKLVRPLTKQKPEGKLYTRPPRIEAAITAALDKELVTLIEQALIPNRKDKDYLPSECLVYLVRNALRSGDDTVINALTPILFARCKATLDREPAKEIREQVRDKFVDLLARDRVDRESDALDYFEVSFSHAFLTRRYDALRAQTKRRKVFFPLVDEGSDDETEVDLKLRKSTEDALVAAHFERGDPVLRNELMAAVAKLPEDERQAIVLVHLIGYDEESENPKKVTAATLCGVTGRTIRNRLAKAFLKLQATTSKQ